MVQNFFLHFIHSWFESQIYIRFDNVRHSELLLLLMEDGMILFHNIKWFLVCVCVDIYLEKSQI